MAELKVLFATSEVAPLIKTGGLADVSGALPAALRAIGLDVRVLVPGYSQVMSQLPQHEFVANLDGLLLGFPPARLLSSIMPNGVPVFVLDCPNFYQRAGGPYQDTNGRDWVDSALRFGLLSKTAAVLGSAETPLRWQPDLVQRLANRFDTCVPAFCEASGSQRHQHTQPGFPGDFPLFNTRTIEFATLLFQH